MYIWKTITPKLSKTNELNAHIDIRLTSDTIAPSISSHILGDELSDSSSRDIYLHCWTELLSDTGHPVAPKLVNHGIPIIDILEKSFKIWSPVTRIIRTTNITHWSSSECDVGQVTAAGYAAADYRKENYKTDLEIWNKNSKLHSECKII